MASKTLYATTKKRYSETELRQLGFRPEGYEWVKRGAGRTLLATASGTGDFRRITPYVRYWR